MSHLMNTYSRENVAFVRGEGVWLFDEQGKRYLDALSGVAVNTLGHAHPELIRAIAEQAGRILHSSNLFRIREQERAAELLCRISDLDEVFFCNSGCEANEAAIKLARLYGHKRGIRSPRIIVMDRAFHGRTLGALSATGNPKHQAGFEPLVPGFIRVPFDDLDAIRQVADGDDEIVAVLVEPIQGEGGVHLARLEYLQGLRALCDEREWLLVCDEVQCGLGRTGKWFVCEHAGVRPDVITLAKGLGSGVPVGACVAGGRARGVFQLGSHASTFGGNHLAMAAVITTLEVLQRDGLLANADRIGRAIREGLSVALQGANGVREVRGAGLMLGVELDRPCGGLVRAALELGIVLNVTQANVIRMLPALIFGDADAEQLVAGVARLVHEFGAR